MKDIPRETIEKAASGDREAFRQVYETACGFVYTVSLHIVNNETDAEEVTQEVFLKLYRSLKDFQFRSSLKTWLYRVTINAAINAYRKRARDVNRRVDFEDVEPLLEAPAQPMSELDKQDQQNAILALLQPLPPQQRACIILREIEGLSYKEIADSLHTKINTVRTWLRRARERLLAHQKTSEVIHELR
jgi:RNA polymerase sigma-70 factor, ECF subfamily